MAVWFVFFLLVASGEGRGAVFETQAQCEEARTKMVHAAHENAAAIQISPCLEVRLSTPTP